MRVMVFIVLSAVAVGGIFLASGYTSQVSARTGLPMSEAAIVDIVLPDTLSSDAKIGKRVYEVKCATCHGINGVGQQEVAPPLVHVIYEPSHHGDEAFQRAAAFGVRGHHWPFGDMPGVEGLTRGEVAMIVSYIRELQRANDID